MSDETTAVLEPVTWRNETRTIGQLLGKRWKRNPRYSTPAIAANLRKTLAKFGQPQDIVIGPHDELYDGHQRLGAWGEAYGAGFVVTVKVASRELTEDEREEYVLQFHVGAMGMFDWDKMEGFAVPEILGADFLLDWQQALHEEATAVEDFVSVQKADEPNKQPQGDEPQSNDPDAGVYFPDLPLAEGTPDALWATDNQFGIPLLSLERQADVCELPVTVYGNHKRTSVAGLLLFYTEDYRFQALWQNPSSLPVKQINAFVEPNFSVYQNFPLAVALWRTYQKRWLARYWQSLGMRCFVDLNVNPNYYEVNLLGVPKGWKAWATRGYNERLDFTEFELAMAKEHAGTNDILFVVYGGGKKVKEWCESQGVIWISETMDRKQGLFTEVIYG